ncbi:MAG: phospholipid carrier-dependent glycosyltransferase [Candidatus Omnitrophica bacterium]|nr:phospholipid carrier-dependent glycosyltransferase [Candidatus Omnitrophota bacterium]
MSRLKPVLILIILSYLFFMLGNSVMDLTNPDEVFYSQTAKEMAQQKTWMVPYLFGQPQFEKPILTYWLLRLGAILFGFSGFGMRFFPALFAMIGVVAIYLMAFSAWRDQKKAFLCALILASSGLYIGLARTVFTDMIFSIFILLSLVSFFLGFVNTKSKRAGLILFFTFCALAVLTKGPLGFIIPFLAILLFLGIKKDLKFLFCRYSLWGFLLFLGIAVPWYFFMIKKFGSSFITEFFYNDHIRRLLEAEHRANDSWYFYPASMVSCMFPWSIFVAVSFPYLFKRLRERASNPAYLFLGCWIFITFIIFQFAHSKLVSYIFPLFPALAVITGDFIYNRVMDPNKRQIFILLLISCFILLSLPIGLVVSSIKYPGYLPSKNLLYIFILLYAVLPLSMLFLILKRKILASVYLLTFVVFLFLTGALLARNNLNAYLSSRGASEYLLKNYTVETKIVCSKSFVRGVRFFTDKDVVVFDQGGTNFFSPHPIAYLNSGVVLKDFLKQQPVTYCIVAKSSLSDVESTAVRSGLKLELLKVVGNECVARIQLPGK